MNLAHPIALAILLFSLATAGCSGQGSNTPEATGPGGVRLGMKRMEVVQVMLDEVQLLQMSGQAKNPYATRFVNDLRDEQLEVMYYYTGMKKGDDLVTQEELIPVILKNNAVIGWGWTALEEMVGSRPVPGLQNVEPRMQNIG